MAELRQIQTALVIDRQPVHGELAPEPYEAGWAAEAIAFVYVDRVPDGREGGARPTLSLRVEVSADGRRWIDDGGAFDPIAATGGYRLKATHFGNWLRLVGAATGASAADPFVVDVYWVFKG